MKANELMIGDWVKIKTYGVSDQFERTEAYIYVKVAEIGSGLITVDYNNDIKEPYRICENTEIESIPLTPEILEKNGFKPYIPENHLETVYACQDVSKAVADELYALWPYQDGSFYLLLRVNGKDMVRIDVRYMHQLQHAFRLCGIEKEIEL